jgi:hypothetical protein
MLDLLEERRPLNHGEFNLRLAISVTAQEQATQIAIYWRQRGKVKECKLGDANTQYFHLSATVKWRSQISVLTAEDGLLVSSHNGKAAILHDFYKKLLGTTPVCSSAPANLHQLMQNSSLVPSQAAVLVEPFSLEEIKTVLLSMRSDCAPGPDGFSPHFYKQCWTLITCTTARTTAE